MGDNVSELYALWLVQMDVMGWGRDDFSTALVKGLNDAAVMAQVFAQVLHLFQVSRLRPTWIHCRSCLLFLEQRDKYKNKKRFKY